MGIYGFRKNTNLVTMKYGIKTDKSNYNAYLGLAEFPNDILDAGYEEINKEVFDNCMTKFLDTATKKGKPLRFNGKELIEDTYKIEKYEEIKINYDIKRIENSLIELSIKKLAMRDLNMDIADIEGRIATLKQEAKDKYNIVY